MLTINPAKRITAHEALKHPWVCVSPCMQTLGSSARCWHIPGLLAVRLVGLGPTVGCHGLRLWSGLCVRGRSVEADGLGRGHGRWESQEGGGVPGRKGRWARGWAAGGGDS